MCWLETHLKRIGGAKAKEVLDGLAIGANLDARSPILVLRKKLEDERAAQGGKPKGKQGILGARRPVKQVSGPVSAADNQDDQGSLRIAASLGNGGEVVPFRGKVVEKKEAPVADTAGIAQMAIVLVAWNRFIRGQSTTASSLYWRPDMGFPVPLKVEGGQTAQSSGQPGLPLS